MKDYPVIVPNLSQTCPKLVTNLPLILADVCISGGFSCIDSDNVIGIRILGGVMYLVFPVIVIVLSTIALVALDRNKR